MVEMLRNVLDRLYKGNESFREHLERVYRQRVLELHLPQLWLFRDLRPEHFTALRPYFDTANIWPRLSAEQAIRSWPDFGAALVRGAATVGPQARVWELLPDQAQAAARAPLADEARRQPLVEALNALIDGEKFALDPAFAAVVAGLPFRLRARDLPDPAARQRTPNQIGRINRLLLETLYPQLAYHRIEWLRRKSGEVICLENEASDGMFFIRSGFVQVVKDNPLLWGAEAPFDWPALCAALDAGGQKPSGPERKVWDMLPEVPVRAAICDQAAGKSQELSSEGQTGLLEALNALLQLPAWSTDKDFTEVVKKVGLKAPAKPAKWDQCRELVAFHHAVLSALFPTAKLPPLPRAEAPRILAYHSEGDPIGEMGVRNNEPRSATCIAYDHPTGKFGEVELLRISKDLFAEMLRVAPELGDVAGKVVEERAEQTRRRLKLPVWQEEVPVALTGRYDELGLIQGQKLMVIDLGRCTRCDKCVEACAATHGGQTRLFLDGPRFFDYSGDQLRNYLVPATCRQCKDSVCLIDCPVGSIHKGENGQIVIENWCIGCSRCAMQCPYGAIQMHAIGVLRRGERDWHYCPTGHGRWAKGQAPFRFDRALLDQWGPVPDLTFRREFPLSRQDAQSSKSFHLQVWSMGPAVEVQVNGQTVIRKGPGEAPKLQSDKGARWNLEAFLDLESRGGTGTATLLQPVLRLGKNEVTVRVRLTTEEGQDVSMKDDEVLLELGLYGVHEPKVPPQLVEEYSQDKIMNTAVVCDMCGGQDSERTACVNACPHEATMRVEARSFFQRNAI
jgi:Fe-S-cluster-containing hydrogenase component 2/CRP-like cAMP-binding protein